MAISVEARSLEFKRRNGFLQVNFPRYYVPLTLRGKLFVWLRLYREFSGLIPEPILQPLLDFGLGITRGLHKGLHYNRRNSPV